MSLYLTLWISKEINERVRQREDKVKRVRDRENIKSAVFLYPLNFLWIFGLSKYNTNRFLTYSPRQKLFNFSSCYCLGTNLGRKVYTKVEYQLNTSKILDHIQTLLDLGKSINCIYYLQDQLVKTVSGWTTQRGGSPEQKYSRYR